MTETRYDKDKIYIPRKIRERLRLTDGDVIKFEITEKGEIRLIVLRIDEARKRILDRLRNPPDLGKVLGQLRRTELYEDVA